MGKIIDKDYYRNEWMGQDTTDENLDKNINKAEKIISLYLNVTLESVNLIPDTPLKDAVASQAEFMILKCNSVIYNDYEIDSAKIGDFNYKKTKSNPGSNRKLCDLSYDYLVRSEFFGRYTCGTGFGMSYGYGGGNCVY